MFGLGSAGVGWLTAVLGAGGVLAGPVAAVLVRGQRVARCFAAGVAGWGAPMILLAFAHASYWPYLMFGLIGAANVVDDAGVYSALQQVIPGRLMGRALGMRQRRSRCPRCLDRSRWPGWLIFNRRPLRTNAKSIGHYYSPGTVPYAGPLLIIDGSHAVGQTGCLKPGRLNHPETSRCYGCPGQPPSPLAPGVPIPRPLRSLGRCG